ncbi:MAG: hypothetical protein KY467_08150 [Gemmatimonadetes bacterium]|nr:hypothetical protein [Gemmatimonadota bacterium]
MLLVAAAGCSGLLSSSESTHTSRAFEPPQSWEAGVVFLFRDSVADPGNRYGARVEFFDGAGRKVVASGRDLFRTESGEVRTPWYRIWLPRSGEYPATVRITIGDSAGEQTVATYPLTVKNDVFYYVRFGIASFDHAGQRPTNPIVFGLRAYPVPAGARRAPGDSLWVSWVHRGRYCFDCPR